MQPAVELAGLFQTDLPPREIRLKKGTGPAGPASAGFCYSAFWVRVAQSSSSQLGSAGAASLSAQ